MNIKDIKKGALIIVRPDYGRGSAEVVQVTFVDKGNKMVVYKEYDNKKERWAYMNQIDGLAV
jgi:hypothetical protein